MLVTLIVLKLLRSKELRAEHFENIPYVVVTLAVLKWLTSISFSEEQPENI